MASAPFCSALGFLTDFSELSVPRLFASHLNWTVQVGAKPAAGLALLVMFVGAAHSACTDICDVDAYKAANAPKSLRIVPGGTYRKSR